MLVIILKFFISIFLSVFNEILWLDQIYFLFCMCINLLNHAEYWDFWINLCTLCYLISESSGGLVFGISLSQCLENDRLARVAAGEISDVGSLTRSSRHGSRTSFSSLIETPNTVAAKTDDVSNNAFFVYWYMIIYYAPLIWKHS